MDYRFHLNAQSDLVLNGHNLGYSYTINPGLIVMLWATEKHWTGRNLFSNRRFKGESLGFNSDLERLWEEWEKFANSKLKEFSDEEFNWEALLHYAGGFSGAMREGFEWKVFGENLFLDNKTREKEGRADSRVVELREDGLYDFFSKFRSFVYENQSRMPAIPGWMKNVAIRLKEIE